METDRGSEVICTGANGAEFRKYLARPDLLSRRPQHRASPTTASTSPSSCTTASRSPATKNSPRTCNSSIDLCIAKIRAPGPQVQRARLEGMRAPALITWWPCRGRTPSWSRGVFNAVDGQNQRGDPPSSTTTPPCRPPEFQGRQGPRSSHAQPLSVVRRDLVQLNLMHEPFLGVLPWTPTGASAVVYKRGGTARLTA